MRCPRYNRLMVPDRFQDLQDNTAHIHFHGTRCLVCGEILGQVIPEIWKKRQLALAH